MTLCLINAVISVILALKKNYKGEVSTLNFYSYTDGMGTLLGWVGDPTDFHLTWKSIPCCARITSKSKLQMHNSKQQQQQKPILHTFLWSALCTALSAEYQTCLVSSSSFKSVTVTSRSGLPVLQQNEVFIYWIHSRHVTAILHLHHADEQFGFYDLFPNLSLAFYMQHITKNYFWQHRIHIALLLPMYSLCKYVYNINCTFVLCNWFSMNISHWVLNSSKRTLLKSTQWHCEYLMTALPTACIL